MKAELREITHTIEVYISDDGVVFDNPSDCEQYELTKIARSLRMYDSNGDRTNDEEEAILFESRSKDDNLGFMRLCEYSGIRCNGIEEDQIGLYVYIETVDSYVFMPELLEKIRKDEKKKG